MKLLSEILQEDPIEINSFILIPFGGNNYELVGKETKAKLGNFIKTEEGYQFMSSNPFFRYFQYKFEPFKDIEEIKRAITLIKKKY